jgi:hypothetical protein
MSPPLRRESHHIDRRQATNFFAATRFAEQQGRPLNILVTFNLDHTTCPPERASDAFEKLRDNRFTRWLSYRRSKRPRYGPPTHVWVIENCGGDTHVHWAVYVPKPLLAAFRAILRNWLTSVVGVVDCEQSAIHTEPIYGAARRRQIHDEGHQSSLCAAQLREAVSARHRVRETLRLQQKPRPRCTITRIARNPNGVKFPESTVCPIFDSAPTPASRR